jgi:hypothetical protein
LESRSHKVPGVHQCALFHTLPSQRRYSGEADAILPVKDRPR